MNKLNSSERESAEQLGLKDAIDQINSYQDLKRKKSFSKVQKFVQLSTWDDEAPKVDNLALSSLSTNVDSERSKKESQESLEDQSQEASNLLILLTSKTIIFEKNMSTPDKNNEDTFASGIKVPVSKSMFESSNQYLEQLKKELGLLSERSVLEQTLLQKMSGNFKKRIISRIVFQQSGQ